MAKSTLPPHMSTHSDTITLSTPQNSKTAESVILSTVSGKQVELKTTQLEKWLAAAEVKELNQKKEKEAPNSYWATQFVGRFGLKSAQDVITFLKSPAGGSVKALIGAQLAELAFIKEELQQYYRDKQTRRHRLLAFLLLGLLYSRAAKAKHLRESIEEQIDKLLHRGQHAKKEQKASDEGTISEILLAEYAKFIQAYEHATQEMQNLLDEKLLESQALEDEMKLLQEQEIMLNQKYSIFAEHLEQWDKQLQIGEYEALSSEEKINFLQKSINELTEKLDKQADTISALLEANKDGEAAKLLQEHNGLHLQAASLKDQLAGLKQTKSFYDSEGRKLNSFSDADFILSHEQKIVKENGKYYLLSAHQDFDSLDINDKAKAQERFERAKPEITPLKKLVKHNQNLETSLHQEKKNSLTARSEAMQTDLLLLTNQINQMQAAQAQAVILMQQQQQPQPQPNATTANTATEITAIPRPSHSAKTKSTPPTIQFNSAQSYRHILQLMRTNPTPEAIDRFKTGLLQADSQVDKRLAQMVTQIKPGKPIPEELMRNLLKLVGEDSAKSSVATPTPFSKKPR